MYNFLLNCQFKLIFSHVQVHLFYLDWHMHVNKKSDWQLLLTILACTRFKNFFSLIWYKYLKYIHSTHFKNLEVFKTSYITIVNVSFPLNFLIKII